MACACPRTSRRRLHHEDRPVILPVSQEDTSCPTSLCDALTEQSARGSLACEHSDLLTLDYVAFGSTDRF